MPLVGHANFEALSEWAERRAAQARALLHIEDSNKRIDVIDALRRLQTAGVIFGRKLVPDEDLPSSDAQWDPVRKTITIRRSVFEAAKNHDARARFTLAHEIAHAFLQHRFRRNRRTAEGTKDFGALLQTQEMEANQFAAAFLCPEKLAEVSDSTTAAHLRRTFGISLTAAEIRLLELKRRRSSGRTLASSDLRIDSEDEPDSYETYMRAVLRQAVMHPE